MLSPAHRLVLESVARRVVPHAYADGLGAVDVIARIEERLVDAPPEKQRDLERALTVLGSRVAALLISGTTVPFPRATADQQDAMLTRWSTSRSSVARAVYEGVRRLIVGVYYSVPESWDDIGYLGP